MDNIIEINGTVAPGFDWVREEFAEENGESGAQLAAFVHGEQVVDLWAGPQVTGDTSTGFTPVDVLTLPNDPGVRAQGQGSAGGSAAPADWRPCTPSRSPGVTDTLRC
ncbi:MULTISPECIES: hypothetical protein [unclassified Nocardia]|uniref:hypothetical protein n=1 Tax=unclassified Nocardia TaxID=2637762 RepID=UPI00341226BF